MVSAEWRDPKHGGEANCAERAKNKCLFSEFDPVEGGCLKEKYLAALATSMTGLVYSEGGHSWGACRKTEKRRSEGREWVPVEGKKGGH